MTSDVAAGVEYPRGTSSRCALGRPLASGGDFVETRLRDQKRPPPRPKSEPSEAGPIWKGGATKRYKVFGASPQTDAGNAVSAVCSDAVVPAAGVEPARVISPTDFESVTSANSITPACASHITITFSRLQALFPHRMGPRQKCRGPSLLFAKSRSKPRHYMGLALMYSSSSSISEPRNQNSGFSSLPAALSARAAFTLSGVAGSW